MFKPNATVAAIVQCKDKFLMVEEVIDGKHVFNQPAGHIEDNESIITALSRELYEETSLHAEPQHFLSVTLWRLSDELTFLRFNFSIVLDKEPKNLVPLDNDIHAVHWLTLEQIKAKSDQMRSHLVIEAIEEHLFNEKLPLSVIKSYL